MRNRFRRFAALALLALFTTALAACGGGGGDEPRSAGDQSKLSGTVTVWDSEYNSIPEYSEAVDKIDAEFEKLHPDVRVDREAQPPANIEAIYRAAFTAHEGPDVMVFQPGAAGILSFSDGLEPINDYMDPGLQDELTEWASVSEGFTDDGEHYGVPLGVNSFVFYYNKKLFKQAGLPTDFQPKTWDEVIAAGEKLKAAGIQPFSGGAKDGYENLWWFSVGFQSQNTPEQTVELANGEIPYTDEAVAEAFNPAIETQEAGFFPADRFERNWFPDGYQAFKEEKAAMVLGLWSVAGYWREFIPELGEKNLGMYFVPETEALGTLANIAYGIPKFSKNKEAAWALLEYTASKKGEEILHSVGGYLPNRKDIAVASDAPVQERELLQAHQDRESVLAPFAVVPATVAFGPMATEISQVLQGRTSLESALETMQEFADKGK